MEIKFWRKREAEVEEPDPCEVLLEQLNEEGYDDIVYHLGAVFSTAEERCNWLQMPNPDLNGCTPMEYIQNGSSEVVLELLEDMDSWF